MRDLYSIIYTPGGNLIRLAWVLCFSVATITLIIAIRQKRRPLYAISATVHFVLSFFMLTTVLDGTYAEHFFEQPRRYYPFVHAVYDAPWIVTVLLIIASAVISTVLFVTGYRYSITNISKSAIKESIDMLPTGICFFNTHGMIVFNNAKMIDLCREVTGEFSGVLDDMWQAVVSVSEQYGESYLAVCNNDMAVLFTKTCVDYYGEDYTQVTASDVSASYRVMLKYKKEQSRLLDIQRREKEFSKNVEKLAKSKEKLYLSANFHDEIGHLLLRGRYHFEHPDESDSTDLLKMIRESNSNLFDRVRNDDSDSDGDSYLDSLSLADTIGVTVITDGEPPIDRDFRKLVARAVRECSVNIKKHVKDGNILYVNFSPDRTKVTFTNNGEPPCESITPAGGLLTLKIMAEEIGGEIILESLPEFKLILKKD